MATTTHLPGMEFHVSRKARDRYRFDESLFSLSGNVVFANFRAARVFAQKINAKKDLVNFPEQAVRAGQITAMGLIDEILHYVMGLFRDEINPGVMEEALEKIDETLGAGKVNQTLSLFIDQFPPVEVYRQKISVETYLKGETNFISNRCIALEEMLLLWLANINPAFSSFTELFDDSDLKKESLYLPIVSTLREFFDTQPPFGPQQENLLLMLRSPAVAVPHSLPGQIEYIRERWGYLLRGYLHKLLGSLDLFKEEDKLPFMGPGPSEIYRYTGMEPETERFSPDRDWMPRLVLLAKNTYVWLHQLSRKYGQEITRLDQIRDEELDSLEDQGISGLWLIGIWERSPASQKIKQMCGNPEAVPSAYSLFDYRIAADIGGEEAYQNLRDRAWKRSIRIASDMVPNHVGIYSQWVVEHPDWFVSLDQNPFPWYNFEGPDLSHDERVGIFIENHYYTKTDAAVVFKRTDTWTGSEKYVYHGNDGTSMPWNDTAQLDYLNPEVREAMIQTILHVAHKFPVIRFDAAMTLTKRHYQRLWFPEPGTGGAIPTRTEHGLTKAEFNRRMPAEFWREVVDRVALEAPDTLLLAEAFWLLEGYFVRTLGMHRVYNSAFMNMLRDEDNGKYRTVMKNTLEFEPEVLRRFVNFMNNPDERTAVDQFGKDDKYFGVCTLLVTLPGLPMLGHGQIEGYAEKYGMEYRRAYWDEDPDQHLVRRHEREIFPLLHRRYLFAGVEHFLLYDFFTSQGQVNEDVFAYSNGTRDERALVVYHNRNALVSGWIRTSVAFSSKSTDGSGRMLDRKTLGEGLQLDRSEGWFTIFKDHRTGLEYIRGNRTLNENGLYVELGPYGYHVFLEFRQVADNESHHYSHLASYLTGRGVPSIEDALKELFLQPIHTRFKEVAGSFERLADVSDGIRSGRIERLPADIVAQVEQNMEALAREAKQYTGGPGDPAVMAAGVARCLKVFLTLPTLRERLPEAEEPVAYGLAHITPPGILPYTLFGWFTLRSLGKIVYAGSEAAELSRSWIDEWLFGTILSDTFVDAGFDNRSASLMVSLIKLLTSHQDWCRSAIRSEPYKVLESFLTDADVQDFLQINRYKEILWFNKEAFEQFLAWLLLISVIQLAGDGDLPEGGIGRDVNECYLVVRRLAAAAEESDYQVGKLLELTKQERNGH
jgi:glycosidase